MCVCVCVCVCVFVCVCVCGRCVFVVFSSWILVEVDDACPLSIQ